MRSPILCLLLLGACGSPPVTPLAITRPPAPPPAPSPSATPAMAAAPSPTSPPGHAMFFVGARRGKELFVLAYRTQTGTLEPVGGALPFVTGEPNHHPPPELRIEYLWHLPGDRVFALPGTGRAWQVFAGAPGRDWRLVAVSAGEHPHISDDGELISVSTTTMYNGDGVPADQVITWDGKIVFESRWQERRVAGFLETGRSWITAPRDRHTDRLVHGIGQPARRFTASDHWYDEQAGSSVDRHELQTTSDANGDTIHLALERPSGREIARYRPQAAPGTRPATYVLTRALRGETGAAAIAVLHQTGGCGDVPCVRSWAVDLWIFGRGGARVERLYDTNGHPPGLAFVHPMIDPAVRHAVWIADRSTLEHYDITTGARRRIQTPYELLTEETPRR